MPSSFQGAPPNKLAGKFRSHRNYLEAFSRLAGFSTQAENDPEVLREIAEKVRAAFPRTGTNRRCNERELAACLNRAWGTELILASNAAFDRDDDFVRIANSWSCVQTYYIGYSATQGLTAANGDSAKGHARTQEQWIAHWSRRTDGVAPFSFAASHGSVLHRDPGAYLHGPRRKIHVRIHSWSTLSNTNAWDIAAAALRSTREEELERVLRQARERKIKEKAKAWRIAQKERGEKEIEDRPAPQSKTAQLSQAEKDGFEKGLRPYGLLDYLYRLRLKANYEDTDMFTEGPEDESSSILVANTMTRLAAAIMIAHEIRIAQLLETGSLLDLAQAWTHKNTSNTKVGIGVRLPILKQVLS